MRLIRSNCIVFGSNRTQVGPKFFDRAMKNVRQLVSCAASQAAFFGLPTKASARLRAGARACSLASDSHANVAVNRTQSGLVMPLRAKRIATLWAILDGCHMLLNPWGHDLLLQPRKQRLAFRHSQFHGGRRDLLPRSMTPSSCSTGLPGTASNNSLIVHFNSKDQSSPPLCILSRKSCFLTPGPKVPQT